MTEVTGSMNPNQNTQENEAMGPIQVLLVEDDPDWIQAMTAFLNHEEDLLVVGAATGMAEVIRMAETKTFDVVLMDIQLNGNNLDGIYTAIELHRIHPAKIIMLTSLSDPQVMTQSFTAGALDYIEKSNFRELPHAIRSAYFRPTAMEALLKEYDRLKREEQLQALTTAEREIFELIEAGYTQTEIMRKLYKAESTLKNQVSAILKKLGVRSSKEAVEKVKRRGL